MSPTASLTSLNFHIFAHYHGGPAMRRARRDLTSAQGDFHQANVRAMQLARSFRVLTSAAMSLGPALVPLAAQLAASAGALATMTVSAGVAAGVWGMALKGAIARINEGTTGLKGLQDKMQKQDKLLATMTPGTKRYAAQVKKVKIAHDEYNTALKQADPAQRKYLQSQNKMKSAWERFITATQGQTLGVASKVVSAMGDAIGKLLPLVSAVTPVANSVADAFQHWVDTKMDKWVTFFADHGAKALTSLVTVGKNVGFVFGKMLKAFASDGDKLGNSLAVASAKLKGWAAGGGFQRFMAYVKGNSGQVKEFFKALGQALMNVAKTMKDLAPLSLLLLVTLAKMVAALPPAVITALVQAFILWRAAVMGMMIVATLTKIIKGAQVAFLMLRFAMLAFPGLWIVLAIAAVIAIIVVIATKTTWFQTAWRAMCSGVKVAFSATWGAIKTAATTVWAFMGGKFKWLLLILGPIGWLLFLLRNWRMVWNGIRTVTNAVWNFIRGHIFNPIVRFFTATIPNAARTLWKLVVAAWNGLRRGVVAAYNAVHRSVFQPIGKFFTRTIPGWGTTMKGKIVSAFKTMVSGVKEAWNKLKGVVAAPVRFFVNTVYNNGLRKAWNNTAGKIPGVPDLPSAHIGFARGGSVRGAGTGTSDSIQARLSHGEFVMNAKSVRMIGVNNLNKMNSMGSTRAAAGNPGAQPGFALGGLVIPNPIDLLKKAGGAAWGALKWGANVVKSIGKKALTAMFAPIRNQIGQVTKKFPKSGMMGTAIKNNALGAIPAMIKFAVGQMPDSVGGANVGFALKWARSQAGKKYQWGGNGNPSWDCSGFMSAIESVIRGQKPHRRWATGSFPPGAPGWKRNLKSPFMIGITNAGVGHTAGTLAGVNVECRGGRGCIVGPGARGANNSMFTSRWGFTGALGGGGGGAAKQIAQSMLGNYGWGQQHWPALNALWQRESGWRTTAKNPSSGAYGIPQALPASKMRSAGADWRTNPATQIKWGLGYIKSRYGNPTRANAFQKSHNWYSQGGPVVGGKALSFDSGGYLPKGLSLVNNGTGKPEPLKRLDGKGDGGGVTVEFNDCTFSGGRGDFEDMVVKAVSEAKRKKRL